MNMHTALPDADYGVRTAPDTVRIERLLPGPIERVWQYLTDPQLRAQWFAGGELEPRTGGRPPDPGGRAGDQGDAAASARRHCRLRSNGGDAAAFHYESAQSPRACETARRNRSSVRDH